MAKTDEAKSKLIFEHYPKGDLDLLCGQVGKSRHALEEWARRHGIKRLVSGTRNGDLTKLLDGTMQSYYWLGFYAADGYIAENGHFMCSQSEKDKELIINLAKYLETTIYNMPISNCKTNYPNRKPSYRVNVCDKKIGVQIREMFGIKIGEQKTYKTLNLDWMKDNDTKNIAFLIGFIDGDGYIHNASSIRIQCHKSQEDFFYSLKKKINHPLINESIIYQQFKKSHNDYYATWRFNIRPTKFLLNFINDNNLICSQRKWT